MFQNNKLLAVGMGLILVCSGVNANPKTCAQIENDAERLACYDNLFAHFTTKSKNTSKNIQAKRNAASKHANVKTEFEAPKRPVGNNINPLENEQSEEELFGAENLEQEENSEGLQSISSVVTKVSTDSRGLRTFTLSNGQVWREAEASRLLIKEESAVTIDKGLFSSYHMGKTSSNRRVRVKRLR